MRASLVVSLLLMLFLLQEAQGIRLEKGFMQVGAQKVQADQDNTSLKQISTGVLGEEVILCKEGHCTSTLKKRLSRSVSKKSSHHWSPRIHEDYCGPRHHKPRHH
ncbi:hypothetical protein POPTR_006G059900v4 [Populus trichocarpa]|uniref:Uncharacterized protein n=1 Tax=Populus trichocarpa TaxID=3694 RepID=B9N6Y1_POPTR|nr:hypothetical protein BDE02_06G050900 [Populus trichocarpa]PNT30008.1 hypothetical protein POPTR_006G059900v4 [Populus trichocarpa]|eukprot:XP_006381063.1 uncharacterized protein LOC18099881 [Populus trichocarpa]